MTFLLGLCLALIAALAALAFVAWQHNSYLKRMDARIQMLDGRITHWKKD